MDLPEDSGDMERLLRVYPHAPARSAGACRREGSSGGRHPKSGGATLEEGFPEPGEVDWQDTHELEAMGIGPLTGQAVPTSGLAGGGLAVATADGWAAERLVLDWPAESLLLVPPGSCIYETRPGRSAEFTKVAVESELRAWGFSPTGKSLVIATSSDVTIFGRS